MKREFSELARKNFEECQIAEGKCDYSLDEQAFDNLDAQGFLHITTARHWSKMAGYVLTVMMPRHLQFEARCSQQIGMYLLPQHRKGTNGLKLLAQDEALMRRMGVQKMYRGHTMAKNLEPLFRRGGWQEVETVYTKWI